MIKNFLLISVRNILRNKGAAYLNILGLTLGMAACIFLFNYIQSHLFYDRLPQAQSVFRVETTTSTRGEITVRDAFTAPVVGPRLANNHGEIAGYARLLPFSEYGSAFFKYQKHDSLALSVFVEKAHYADRSILDVLSLTLLQGNWDS
ncbi:MAG: ABC transporter permease, partial [Imperialibacter sp.]